MKRKLLKIVGVGLLLIVGLLFTLPLLLEGKISEIIKNKVNQNINATLDFESASLSLLKSFPNAHLELQDLSLINNVPFEGDTLFAADAIALKMRISELFKSAEEPIGIKSLEVDGAYVLIQNDAEGNANYDIGKASSTPQDETASETNSFSLELDTYAITNSQIIYKDLESGMRLSLTELNHSGTGDLSLEQSELNTLTDALVSFEMDSTRYLNNNKLFLDALIGIDLNQNKYSFLDNKAMVNQLPLVFDGFVQINEGNQEVDITFKTPSSDFKNFLAVVPEAYATNLDGVQTSGNFEVEGHFKGIVDAIHIPTFGIKLKSENASFKYPELPKSVQNVFIDTEIKNESGIADDTYVDIHRLSFAIDQDKFNMNAKLRELTGNTKVNAHLDGVVNLANLSRAYPMPEDYGLKGKLTADVTTAFDMSSLERKAYGNTRTAGQLQLDAFEYNSEELKHPVTITTAVVNFTPDQVILEKFDGKTGNTDFKASGILTNLLGFLFNNENVEGNFSLDANTFALNDFMVEEASEKSEPNDGQENTEEKIKIPSFLDCTINASANTVLYDNLSLRNVKGKLIIKDETAILEGLRSDLFGGVVGVNGSVSTKEDQAMFAMDLGLENLNIGESFGAMELFKTLAPLANALQGKFNSNIKIGGNLNNDFTPDLATISGNLLAELLATKVDAEKAPLFSALSGQLNFLNTEELDLTGLKTALSFDNGAVSVKPFELKYKDIAVNVAGSHTFDRQLQYNATLDVPSKYLGDKVNSLIAKLDDSDLESLTIPVTAKIGGDYSNPKVQTDLSSGISKLTNQLVEIQKQKLVNQGMDKAKDLIADVFNQEKDSALADDDSLQKTIGGLLGNKETTEDSTNTEDDAVKKTAKSVLGSLLGKKKKDSVE